MIYLIIYLVGWILGVIIWLFSANTDFVTALLLAQLVFCVGFFGIFNFIGHSILSRKVAKTIGWTSNGFQKELGFVSLGIGICGILCAWFRDSFWIATTIPLASFLPGAGIVHLTELLQNKNRNRGNMWIILPDFLLPLTIIILLIIKF